MPIALLRSAKSRVPASRALTCHFSRFTPHGSLLATTSLVALLLAAPAKAGETITTPQASVTNPAGATTSFISITGTSVTGAVANAGTITPGAPVGPLGTTVALFVNKSTIGGGIANTGTISASSAKRANAIDLVGSTVVGGIANSSAITVNGVTLADGISISGQSAVSGDITNSGVISASTSGSAFNPNPIVNGIIVTGSTVSGGIANARHGQALETGATHVTGRSTLTGAEPAPSRARAAPMLRAAFHRGHDQLGR